MTRGVPWIFLAVAACARPSLTSTLPVERCEAQWCATAHVEQDGHVEVALIVPPNAGRPDTQTLRLAFAEGILGRGYTDAYVRMLDDDGKELPWPGVFDASKTPDVIRYRVDIPHDPSLPLENVREQSFAHVAGWHLKGYSFLPDVVDKGPDEPPALLRFVLDEGDRALGSVVATEHTFHGRGLSDLVRATYEVGQPHHHCHRQDGLLVCVASSTEDGLEQTTRFVDVAMRETAELLGPLETASVLISVHPTNAPVPLGLAVGNGVVVLANEPPSSTSRTSFALVHEIVHLWNPGKRRVPALWLREGLTEYLAHQVIAKMSTVGEDEFLSRIVEAQRRHAIVGGALEHATGEDVYAAGVMAGYCLDQLLEPSGASTAQIVRHLLAQVPANDATPLTDDWFFAELAKTSASSAGYFRLMMQSPRFDFGRCLRRPL